MSAILDHIFLKSLPFEERFYIAGGILVLIAVMTYITRHYWYKVGYLIKLKRTIDKKEHAEDFRHAARDMLFIGKLLLVLYLIILIYQAFIESPYLVEASPEASTRLSEEAPEITLEFNVPVNTKNVTAHISPETKGHWEWKGGVLGLKRIATFYPEESFYPESEVVLYLVNVATPWNPWKPQEIGLEYSGLRMPKMTAVLPPNGNEDTATNTSLEVTYDVPLGDFIAFNVEVLPDPGPINVELQDNKQIITFENTLQQSQTYQVIVSQAPRSYNVITGEDINRGDSTKIAEWQFTTVGEPLVESFEPRGEGIAVDTNIKLVFDSEMNQQSVEEHFKVEPSIDGRISWEDERTFILNPEAELQKDTEYTVTFTAGFQNKVGGVTGQDLLFKFKTIGPVTVASINPGRGASGVNPSGLTIGITFDQAVDQQSAQDHFSLSPQVGGSFSWSGNQMVYTPNSTLAFATVYTVKVESGVKSINGLDSNSSFSSTFTTKNQSFSLSVPWYKQNHTFTCNIAAARMTLAFRGTTLDEASIVNAIGTGQNPNTHWVDGYGTHIQPIANFINKYRQTETKTNWDLASMLRAVQDGNPVIVWVYNRYSQPAGPFTLEGGQTGYMGMHSEVVRGFIGTPENPSQILTNDSWRGQLNYSRSQFESIWGYMGNTALVVK